VPLDLKLKRRWHFDTKRRAFRADGGGEFLPAGELPRGTRIVYKVPNLEHAEAATLNQHERELRRYLQVILPRGVAPGSYLETVRAWPPVEEAHVGPDVSHP
jgi:hypothetical protein